LRVVVVGLGVQGKKRRAVAGDDVVATVDPVNPDADFQRLEDVDHGRFDAALLCIPDEPKAELISSLLTAGKHVLVEKPLVALSDACSLEDLLALSRANRALLYTAYNHRFEPHFMRMRDLIASGVLGRVYSLRMFYGNGTARLVRDSAWRDAGSGVLHDLGSHLLDTVRFWLGDTQQTYELWSANCFENRALDHAAFGAQPRGAAPLVQLEMTLLSWRNHFYAEVHAENGSAHISSLCKWGPSTFIHRRRVLPSGRPDEDSITLVQSDPTWAAEYDHFKRLCTDPDPSRHANTDTDIWIAGVLDQIAKAAYGRAGEVLV
jgi:predicted dehydrogenase